MSTFNIHCKARTQPCAPVEGTPHSARREEEVTEVSHKGDDSSPSCPQPQPFLPLSPPCPLLQENCWPSRTLLKAQLKGLPLTLFLISFSINICPVGPKTYTSEYETLLHIYLHIWLLLVPQISPRQGCHRPCLA